MQNVKRFGKSFYRKVQTALKMPVLFPKFSPRQISSEVYYTVSNFWTFPVFFIFLLISVDSPDIQKTVYSFYTFCYPAFCKKIFPIRRIYIVTHCYY